MATSTGPHEGISANIVTGAVKTAVTRAAPSHVASAVTGGYDRAVAGVTHCARAALGIV
ncbi:hypothetical protein [Methylibium sp.]|uniref:hypothetical protein n=1 Tax=Methylibium sp. TaxID=2067992 RepID=UPI00185D7CAC|nr:hypothetical protein [Methylibium sp.]MBA3588782.1 hypothetical protein [Methylibium sp.]